MLICKPTRLMETIVRQPQGDGITAINYMCMSRGIKHLNLLNDTHGRNTFLYQPKPRKHSPIWVVYLVRVLFLIRG